MMLKSLSSLPQTSFPKSQIKVLLLENIHHHAKEVFSTEHYQIEALSGSLTPDQLKENIKGVHILGIRSKTRVTATVLAEANRLLTVGCFCIGTNQVDLHEAKLRGIPVFNAPFSNTRSVAEFVISEVIMLARQLGKRNQEMHMKAWKKESHHCFEVRGKTLGIIGYGHIGSQVSTLAEALGMRVLFYDVIAKLPLGNAKACPSLEELLRESHFVTLHVPATPQTLNMLSVDQFQQMKKGAYLINASRGSVVDIPALTQVLRSQHVAGAAIDVFPEEPESNTKSFYTELQGLPNVILTPHIAGSTEEAQYSIGEEVPSSLIRLINTGATGGAVNFPAIDLPWTPNCHRILNIHRNVPGVLSEINRIISDLGANIEAQTLATDPEMGYLILDTDQALSTEVKNAIESLKTSIRTRILY